MLFDSKFCDPDLLTLSIATVLCVSILVTTTHENNFGTRENSELQKLLDEADFSC